MTPEDKLLGFYIAAPTLALALWWFGATIPAFVHAPWIISMLPLALVGFAGAEFHTILASYLTDSYTIYAASANASLSVLRGVLAALFPLFAQQMFEGLGANVASFILAGLATLFCLTPIVFGRYGKRIRLRSKFAGKFEEGEEEE